ncbi:hypothetical protein [Paludisphaera rhizosphaerae]|uniref:hypothetical protein n=1 Tax=Paludisphaera rhizosphaerae TaxID=2711216 RepID=UPI0013EB648C|nr:hypothetical protein [Paludisphaera rhizosphaerae]
MLTPTAVSRALGVLGVIGFMALATTSSIATAGRQQDPIAPALPSFEDPKEPSAAPAPAIQAPPPPVDAAPAPREPEPLKDLPPAPEEPALDVAPPVEPKPKQPKAAPAAVEESTNPLPPARELEPPPAAPAARVSAPEREPVRRTSASAEPAVDDPDARARTFVEKNQREADEQLKALREEAAQLKTRLARVEAGIRRWEALAEALDRSQERASTQPRTGAVDGTPRTTRGGVQYIIPSGGPGVVIQSQPVTRADYVPAPLPR